VNVYDFDNTIYDGESVFDFYIFLLARDFSLIKLLPEVIGVYLKYKRCVITGEELMAKAEKYSVEIMEKFPNMKELVSQFWDKNQRKIKKFYLENQREDDVILSASCGFLIRDVCTRLGIKNVLASEIDTKTGKITRVCFAHTKPEIFKGFFPDTEIENFYTDSLNDTPMFALSKNVYMVKGNKIRRVKNDI